MNEVEPEQSGTFPRLLKNWLFKPNRWGIVYNSTEQPVHRVKRSRFKKGFIFCFWLKSVVNQWNELAQFLRILRGNRVFRTIGRRNARTYDHDFFDEWTQRWNICCGRPPRPRGHLTAAEIGRIASKSCGKATSPSGRSSDASADNPVTVADQDDSILVVSDNQQQNTERTDHQQDELPTSESLQVFSQLFGEVTSTAIAVHEAPGADKTTINIGVTMNHVNDQETIKQLNLTPVQVGEVEEMDTQEGLFVFFFTF